MVWPDQARYEGQWQYGQRSGTGKLYIKVEDRFYEGQFRNGKKNGDGKILDSDGVRVIERGTWKNDVKL